MYLQSFPADYSEALRQAQTATLNALKDGHKLIEVEFPPSSLEAVSGDVLVVHGRLLEAELQALDDMLLAPSIVCAASEEVPSDQEITLPSTTLIARLHTEFCCCAPMNNEPHNDC